MITEEDIAQMLSDLTVSVQKKLWESYFPENGPFARHLFPKHMAFMKATKDFNVCTVFGANRSSKTVMMSYIAACWAMGKYPDWWEGRRIERAPRIWVAGQTTELVKGSLQEYLFGVDGVSGMISADNIEHIFWNQQSPGLIHRVLVRHPAGLAEITFKSYDQGWQRFMSGTIDAAILDEEMPARIFSETVTRTATTNGIVLVGFTGLQGITPLVAHLWPQSVGLDKSEEETHRYHCFIGWKDIPYSLLPEQRRKELIAQYLPNEVRARTEGIPSVGSGMVYPVAEEEFVVEPFEIPNHWRKGFALDPGYRSKTAALWAAWDEDSDTIYLYSEHYQGLAEPTVHVDAMRRRGSWIPCIIDPAGANIEDGKRVKAVYKEAMQVVNEDWPMFDARKSITAGIMEVYARLTSGRLKVFSTCRNWLTEFRQYHRDDTGKIAPTPDHLMDCFIAGTRIETIAGEVNVELIEPGFKVLTVDGYRPVIAAWKTGEREVYELMFSDGRALIGTGSHPIWCDGEWKPLDSMRYGDIVQTCEPSALSSKAKPSGVTRIASAVATEFTIAPLVVSGCMSRYGKKLTALCRKASTFITSTMTRWTTGLKTSPVLTGGSTYRNTMQENAHLRSGHMWIESGRLLKHGMPAKWGASGIGYTALMLTPNGLTSRIIASIVESNTPRATLELPSSVIKTAKPQLYVVGVKKLQRRQPVYNLQVADTPEYFANGVRVHNCTRYIAMGTKHFTTKPVEFGTRNKRPAKMQEVNPFGL